MLKSQDFLVLVKLISVKKNYQNKHFYSSAAYKTLYNEISYLPLNESELYHEVSVRNLGNSLGVSKSEVSSSLKRCINSKLLTFNEVKLERLNNLNSFDWVINTKALFKVIQYAFPYFYPIEQTGMTYGLKTGFSAPILSDKLISGGEIPYIWATEQGNTFGLGIEPIYKSVPFASKHDEYVYSCFALIDALRAGQPREKNIALDMLEQILIGK